MMLRMHGQEGQNPREDEPLSQNELSIEPATVESWWLGAPLLCNVLSILPWLRLPFLPKGSEYAATGPFVLGAFIAFGSLLICLNIAAHLFKSRKFGRSFFSLVFGLT